jgi:hypothetical protein
MMYRLAKPMRQLLAVTLALAVVATVALAVIGPVWARVTDLTDSIAQERMVMGRLKALVTAGSGNEKLEERAVLLRQSGLGIGGASAPIRQAVLQSQLSEIASGSGVKLRSTHALLPREQASLRLVGTQMQLVATLEDVQRLIIAIEDHKPALFIDTMSIVPSSSSGLPNDDKAGLLDARFDVYAVELR